MKVRIALAQTITSPIKQKNLDKALILLKKAADDNAKIIIFPEFFMGGNTPENINGPFITSIAEKARDQEIYVAIGIRERSLLPTKDYNTIVLLNPKGSIIGVHRKLHLFDAFDYKESETVVSGDEITLPIETEIGILGIITCYEIRFPELTRILTLRGTEILIVPSAWKRGLLKEDQWLTLMKARALENTIFVAAVGKTGDDYSGRSVIVDPFGIVISDAGEEEKLLITEIDLNRIKKVRKILPVLKHRRTDLYNKY